MQLTYSNNGLNSLTSHSLPAVHYPNNARMATNTYTCTHKDDTNESYGIIIYYTVIPKFGKLKVIMA